MNYLNLDNTIKMFSEYQIEELVFSYPEYAHYHHCVIRWNYEYLQSVKKYVPSRLEIRLSSSEACYFPKTINPDLVIFRIKGKGPYTLRDLWEKLEIISIKRSEK